MKANKRPTMAFLVFVLYMSINGGSSEALFYNFIYLVVGGISYLILGIAHHSHYRVCLRKKRMINEILDFTPNKPMSIDYLTIWLKKEGFKLKLTGYGAMYFKSKIAIINYFPTLRERISIISSNGTKKYLIYSEDEEFKFKVEMYMDYISNKYNAHVAMKEKYKIGGGNNSLGYERSFTSMFGSRFVSIYGYLFLILSLYDISSDYVTTIYKVCIIILYSIIEAS